jgi:hypothetical protein
MRIVKLRLGEMLPDVRCFLDVDDLREGKGAEFVDKSEKTLVFCSAGYFQSPNCMRTISIESNQHLSCLAIFFGSNRTVIGELLRAVVTRKPVIALLEVEAKHGGMARETIREKLLATDEPCERDGTMHTSWYQMWGLDAEVEQWGYEMPTCDELYAALFASQPIQWDRIPAFQDV